MSQRSCLTGILLTGFIFILTASIISSTTGRIKGRLTDKETGDPIIGASVQIVGTKRGAQSGLDGSYVMDRVDPGTYTLRVSSVEYQTVEITGVEVHVDSTTEQNFQLEKKVGELKEAITVRGTRDILERFEVSSQVHPSLSACMMAPEGYYPPAHGGTAIVNNEAFDAMFFEHYGVNPFVDTEDDHLSTFAVDVDDASFVMTRSYLERGLVPPEDAVRTEEFINHFKYDYPLPEREAFSISIDGAPSKFGTASMKLLRIGIKGMEVCPENRKPANLIFVIDVSGSMGREDRLGLVRKALRMLVEELTEDDKVGIAVYSSRGEVRLQPTSIRDRHRILRVIENLHPGGSTFAEEGIRLGYEMADKHFEAGKINRIILCSDGVANVGKTGPDQILKIIKKYADKGITLSSIGFGMGNYNDILLEKLGNKGNGHYAYVDDLEEARRVFVENLTGTLQVIARDVKIQVDFNPDVVRSYRLLGYENRDVADDKFRDDQEDGGEIGSGHMVTALYEFKMHKDAEGDVGKVFIRFKDPDNGNVTEVSRTIAQDVLDPEFASASTDLQLAAAAAEFSEIMRDSYWARYSELSDVLSVATRVYSETTDPDVLELMLLISNADQLRQRVEK
jgi:Ca-activated chloride channel family protein